MLGPRIMKLHRYIDHGSQITPIEFQVTRYINHDLQMTSISFEVTGSKVKFTKGPIDLQLVSKGSEVVSVIKL
ncbi:hypothetical protein DPMN_131065 [Dreissena polymorpha]|uniref:Uncharacterized protein n=1 Tax=Dreissena polymorpha TaxID=45954 RepID=A0A9D4H692_DREPO|nr:hypothetical protein DPMN_131065 [Dreissena polymorpha]